MQCSKFEGSSEIGPSSLCPIMVIVPTFDVCRLSWGLCACLLADTLAGTTARSLWVRPEYREEKQPLGISLALHVFHLSLTLRLATSNSSGSV